MSYQMDMFVSTILMAMVYLLCVHLELAIWIQIVASVMVYLFGTDGLEKLWKLCTKISNGLLKS